jgi:hypothetical protein
MYRNQTTATDRAANAIIKEAEAREAEHAASAALADSDSPTRNAILAFVIASPAVTGYSARNLHFIHHQFARRGIEAAALDTWAGWVQRGRCVEHGERAAKVFVPKTVRGVATFRPVGSVFDISQTRPLDAAEWEDMLTAKRLERVTLPDAHTLGVECLAAFCASQIAQVRMRYGLDITGCAAELLATATALANAAAAGKAARTARAEVDPGEGLDLF